MASTVDNSRKLWVKEWILGIYIAAVKVLWSSACYVSSQKPNEGDQKERMKRSHQKAHSCYYH